MTITLVTYAMDVGGSAPNGGGLSGRGLDMSVPLYYFFFIITGLSHCSAKVACVGESVIVERMSDC